MNSNKIVEMDVSTFARVDLNLRKSINMISFITAGLGAMGEREDYALTDEELDGLRSLLVNIDIQLSEAHDALFVNLPYISEGGLAS